MIVIHHPNYQINLHLQLDEKIALNPIRYNDLKAHWFCKN